MSNKKKYEVIKNFQLKKEQLAVVIKTQYGKMVILHVGEGRGLSVDTAWINKDTKGKMSVGIAKDADKTYRTYTNDVMDEATITGIEAVELLIAAGYIDYKFPPQTADEMVASLFSK